MTDQIMPHMTDAIYFASGIPSNFYLGTIILPHPFGGWPVEYPANEYRFHAMKGRNREEHDWVLSSSGPLEAKNRGRALRLTPSEIYNWDHYRSLPVMLEVNLVKFTAIEVCRQWLIQTGTAPLVEHRPDKIWGDGLDGSGKNLLGKVLEIVRVQVR